MVKNYIPKQGDIIYLDFTPTMGHEQKGKRPGIVVSKDVFNKNTKMVMICPITSRETNFPTHHILKETKKIQGSVLCEHVRSIDYEIRNLKYIESASDIDLLSVLMLLNACVE